MQNPYHGTEVELLTRPEKRWQQYRARKRWYSACLYLMPVAILVSVFLGDVFDSAFVLAAVLGVYVFILLALGHLASTLVCRRCGENIVGSWYELDPSRNTCKHCGFAPGGEA